MECFTGYNPRLAESLKKFRGIFRERVYSRWKHMSTPHPNDRLARALATWRVSPPADPNFRPAVWNKIKAPSAGTWSAYVRTHLAGWSVVAGLAIAVGGWTGHVVAQAKLEASREQMAVSYLSELDPRVLAKLRR
jgi:hypothetical protein